MENPLYRSKSYFSGRNLTKFRQREREKKKKNQTHPKNPKKKKNKKINTKKKQIKIKKKKKKKTKLELASISHCLVRQCVAQVLRSTWGPTKPNPVVLDP